jgi:streptogramin lyase
MNMPWMRSCWPLGAVAGLLLVGLAHATPTAYHPALAITDPTLNAISLTGTGFGAPGAGSWVTLTDGATDTELPSMDRDVLLWTEGQIVVKVLPAAYPATIAVTVDGTTTAAVPIEYYVHDWLETEEPLDPGANGCPLAIAVDRRSRLWLAEEFGFYYLKMIDLRTGLLTRYETPLPPDAHNVFCGGGPTCGEQVIVDRKGRVWSTEASNVFCPCSTMPNHSRILMLDPRSPESVTNPRVFNVPGNNTLVVGLAYDQRRRRVWFTEARGAMAAGLASFDPALGNLSADNRVDCPWPGTCDFGTAGLTCETRCSNAPARSCVTANDCQFCQPGGTCSDPPGHPCSTDADCRGTCQIAPGAALGVCRNMCAFCISDAQCFADPSIGCGMCSNAENRPCLTVHDCVLADRVCPSQRNDQRPSWRRRGRTSRPATCIAEYREPDYHSFQPAHVTVDHKGMLWYTNYFAANDIRRFDPATGQFTTFNLPRPPVTDPATAFGAWPWQILAAGTGDILFTGYASGQLGRISRAKLNDPNVDCDNPLSGYDFCGNPQFGASPCAEVMTIPGPAQVVHSIAVDRRGRVWFGAAGAFDDPGLSSSLGFVSKDFTQIVLLPPLSLFPFVGDGRACVAAGEFVSFSGAGVAYDRRSKAILVADYCRKRIVRIRPAGGMS